MTPITTSPADVQLLTLEQCAARLNVKPSWLRERTKSRCPDRIPYVKLGHHVRFPFGSPEFTRWLDSHTIIANKSGGGR